MKLFIGTLCAFLLAVSVATATPVYNLGMPCGSGSGVCNYSYNNTVPNSVTTDGGNSFEMLTGMTSQYTWSSQTLADLTDWGSAFSDGVGNWSQAIGGSSSSLTDVVSWSDYFTFGCCEPDWWNDIVTTNNNQTKSRSGWFESLQSNGIEMIHVYVTWGDSTDTWSSYSRQSGASTYASGARSTYSSESRSNGIYVTEPWSNYFEERYPDPLAPTPTPEPSAWVLSLGGVLLLCGGSWRRKNK